MGLVSEISHLALLPDSCYFAVRAPLGLMGLVSEISLLGLLPDSCYFAVRAPLGLMGLVSEISLLVWLLQASLYPTVSHSWTHDTDWLLKTYCMKKSNENPDWFFPFACDIPIFESKIPYMEAITDMTITPAIGQNTNIEPLQTSVYCELSQVVNIYLCKSCVR